jgi:hypothetical protein
LNQSAGSGNSHQAAKTCVRNEFVVHGSSLKMMIKRSYVVDILLI